MTQSILELGTVLDGRITPSEFQTRLVGRLQRRKAAKLRLFEIRLRKSGRAGNWAGGTWQRPTPPAQSPAA